MGKARNMKKKLCLLLILTTALMTIGCGTTEATTKEDDHGIYYWTDEETGVEYIIYNTSNGGGITPRLKGE